MCSLSAFLFGFQLSEMGANNIVAKSFELWIDALLFQFYHCELAALRFSAWPFKISVQLLNILWPQF